MSTSLNRRRFTQLSAMALAATRLPAQPVKRVGYAAVGLGIISDIFMTACAQSQSATVTGLVTGHPADKGARYAAQYNVPAKSIYTYDTFDHIRDNPDIDAVYIGLPNSMHCEYTVRAAEAGKHVLCEKPMALSSAECRRMIDACRKANVKLMIAYRIHYDPTFARVAELIHSGALGQIQGFDGAFPGNFAAGQWRLKRKMAGGGSVFDLGRLSPQHHPLSHRRRTRVLCRQSGHARHLRPLRRDGTEHRLDHEFSQRHSGVVQLVLRSGR